MITIGGFDYDVFPHSKSLQEIASEQGITDISVRNQMVSYTILAEDWRRAAAEDWSKAVVLNKRSTQYGERYQGNKAFK